MITSLDALKKPSKNTAPLHAKSLGEIRNSWHITKHDKSNIQQSTKQHKIKWRVTGSNPTKIRGKTRLYTLSLSIQYSTYSSSWSNQTMNRDQRDANWKERSQSITICRLSESIHKQLPKFHQSIPIVVKQLYKCDRL